MSCSREALPSGQPSQRGRTPTQWETILTIKKNLEANKIRHTRNPYMKITVSFTLRLILPQFYLNSVLEGSPPVGQPSQRGRTPTQWETILTIKKNLEANKIRHTRNPYMKITVSFTLRLILPQFYCNSVGH